MAGELRQEWTWRDIFRSIGLAFSFSRLVTGLIGIALFAVSDSLLVIAAREILAGAEAGSWTEWLGGEVFTYLRFAVATMFLLFTATAIAYSAKGELLEGEGAGVGESIGFAFKKFGAIFFTPVLFWVYIIMMGGFAFCFFVLPVMISQWIGWTPVVSLVWYTLNYLFLFLFSVLAAMGVLAFAFSFFLSPAIIAVRQEGALDAVLDTIDLMRGKGAFWVAYVVMLIALWIGRSFLPEVIQYGYAVSHRAMGDEFALTVEKMPSEIKVRSYSMVATHGKMAKYWPQALQYSAQAEADQRHTVAGWIFGLWVMIIAGLCVSFALGAFVSAGTLTYLIVREEEEFLEPVIEAPPKAPAAEAKKDEKKDEKKAEAKKEDKKEDTKKSTKKSGKKDTKRDSKRKS